MLTCTNECAALKVCRMTKTGNQSGRRPIRLHDYGFFGPDSPTWKVWTSPTAVIGFQRAVVLEHFDPFLAAAVADMGGIYQDPIGRLDRTLAYFLTVAVGDSRTAIEAAEFLMDIHAKVTGVEPISGKPYSANAPRSQLWIHITGWHSVLKCYEMYGPGPLSPKEEERYWADCVIAAELQTCNPDDVPRSRGEVRAYFEAVRSQLCSSERAHRGMHYLLRPPLKRVGLRLWGVSHAMALTSIATLPQWMRTTGGFNQPKVISSLVRPVARVATGLLSVPLIERAARLELTIPRTIGILREHRRLGPPEKREVVTPAYGREHYGSRKTRHKTTSPNLAQAAPVRGF